MRRFLPPILPIAALAVSASAVRACGSNNDDSSNPEGGPGDDGSTCLSCNNEGGPRPGCVGLGCKQVDCSDPNVKTTLTGTVFDPAGKVPVFNAVVYVPQDPDAKLPDINDGASCDRCDAKIQNAVVVTATDTGGNFTLKDVPVVDNMPLVIQIGKWRRVVRVASVKSCTTAAVDKTITRLPRNSTEGHIPRIAITTGAADPLQCLLHKVGLDDSEFGIAGQDTKRIHLYQGGGFVNGATPMAAASKLDDNTAFPPADGL